jgi:hypothetical protein
MATNVFQTVPHDVLNYVIAPFLNARERTAFNQVNHPFERVYKKFPTDYAMWSHMRAMNHKYNSITRRLNETYGDVNVEWTHSQAEAATQIYFMIMNVLEDPKFMPIFKYSAAGRNSITLSLSRLYEDVETYDHVSEDMKENLRVRCAEVQAYIRDIPFVREIPRPVARISKWKYLSNAKRAIALRAGHSDQD